EGTNLRSLTFSADGCRLFSGGDDRDVRVWDVVTGRELASFSLPAIPYALAMAPNGRHLMAGCTHAFWGETAGSLHVWDVEGNRHLHQCCDQCPSILPLAVSPDSRLAISAGFVRGGEPDYCLWNLETGQEVRRWNGPPAQGFSPAAFSPDGTLVLAGGA